MQQHSRLAVLSLFPDGHFRLIRDLKLKSGKEKGICRNHRAREEQLQDANEPAARHRCRQAGKQPRI